jgi:glycosyltransferase involved in cell wall biosynthesis
MKAPASLSIILPATDEPASLTQAVTQIKQLFANRTLQLIVVTHPTLTTPECHQAIALLQRRFPDVESLLQTRSGLGGAIQDAFERCTGSYTALMSADLETDPAVLPTMVAAVERGADIAVATRWRNGVRFKGYDPLKLALNFFFQQFFRILYWTALTDLTYAYRVYKTSVIKRIRWQELRFPFLFESILKPLRLGCVVVEVDAPWVARIEGASHNSFRQTFDYVRVGIAVRFFSKQNLIVSQT